MTNLLDNPLIRKYFGFDLTLNEYGLDVLARRVIYSMQQPIRSGERFLVVVEDYSVKECVSQEDTQWSHMHSLRLPDRFQPSAIQKQECEDTWRECPQCKQRFSWHEQPKPAPEISQPWKAFVKSKLKDDDNSVNAVEEKIQELAHSFQSWISHSIKKKRNIEEELRELVELARKNK